MLCTILSTQVQSGAMFTLNYSKCFDKQARKKKKQNKKKQKKKKKKKKKKNNLNLSVDLGHIRLFVFYAMYNNIDLW